MPRLLATGTALLCFCLCLGPTQAADPKHPGPQFESAPAAVTQVRRLAVHPLHNPARLIQAYQPLIDHLNAQLPQARLVLEASRDYAAFEEKYHTRKAEFLLPNPWQTLQAINAGYRVMATAGDARDFKGIFVARKGSGLKRPADLKGKAISYPAPTALAACIMPQWFLHEHGVKVTTEIDNRYVGSQESSIMNAYLGKTAAGATWPPPWRAFQKQHPLEAAEMEVLWETEPLINNSVMARDDVPPELVEQVRTALVALPATAAGRAILADMETAFFSAATNADYDPVRRYVARFEREVRPVQTK